MHPSSAFYAVRLNEPLDVSGWTKRLTIVYLEASKTGASLYVNTLQKAGEEGGTKCK